MEFVFVLWLILRNQSARKSTSHLCCLSHPVVDPDGDLRDRHADVQCGLVRVLTPGLYRKYWHGRNKTLDLRPLEFQSISLTDCIHRLCKQDDKFDLVIWKIKRPFFQFLSLRAGNCYKGPDSPTPLWRRLHLPGLGCSGNSREESVGFPDEMKYFVD